MVSKYSLDDLVNFENDIYRVTDVYLYNQYVIYSLKSVFNIHPSKIQVREGLLKPVSEEQYQVVKVLYG